MLKVSRMSNKRIPLSKIASSAIYINMLLLFLVNSVLASEQCSSRTYCPGSYECCEDAKSMCCIQYVPFNSFAGCPYDLPYCNEKTNECLPNDHSRRKPAVVLSRRQNNLLNFFVGFSTGFGVEIEILSQVECIEYTYDGMRDLARALNTVISYDLQDIQQGVNQISQAFTKLANSYQQCGKPNYQTTFESLAEMFSDSKIMSVRIAYNLIYFEDSILEELEQSESGSPYEEGFHIGKALTIMVKKLPTGTV